MFAIVASEDPDPWPANNALVMDVLVLLDTLDDLVRNAKPIRFTHQVRVEKERSCEILEQIRASIPEEIKQARWIVKEREEMLAEAQRAPSGSSNRRARATSG